MPRAVSLERHSRALAQAGMLDSARAGAECSRCETAAMRVGVTVPMSLSDGPGRMPAWADVLAFVRHAEGAGLESVWVCDHFISDPGDRPVEGILEGWTILSALAASTTRVELGQLVMCVSFRNPALLAKMAATADAVSGGRLVLGLGAGWYDAEYEAFGYPIDHRVARFEEALRIIASLLHGESVTFEGDYHAVREAVLVPRPDRHIPILVAGNGRRMLRLTARYAEAWNTAWFGGPDDRLRQQLDDLAAALDAEDRDPATLRRTVGITVEDPDATGSGELDERAFRGSVDELAQILESYEQLDIDDLIVGLAPMTTGSIDRLAEALELWKRHDSVRT
jgi:probable F420-dependent oxidoreductase